MRVRRIMNDGAYNHEEDRSTKFAGRGVQPKSCVVSRGARMCLARAQSAVNFF